MAARLIQRFSRLLVASPHFPPSCWSSPPECIRACHPICAVPLHTATVCRYMDSLPQLKGNVNCHGDNNFMSMIQSMTEPKELLQISNEYCTNSDRAAIIITRIAQVTKTKQAEVVKDKRFQALLCTMDRKVLQLRHNAIVNLLRDLYMLRLDVTNGYLRSCEIEVQWRLKRLSIGLLAQLARICVPHAETKEQKRLVQDLLKVVELRWMEVTNKKTLVNLVSHLGQVSKTLLERMEEKVLEFAEDLTPEESRTITLSLAAQNYRSLPILRALSFHLLRNYQDLQPPVIVDLLYAYAVLNFAQQQVLQKLMSNLLPKVPELSIKMITNVLRSSAKLRFFHLLLCDAVAQVCLDRSQSLTPTELSSVILSFAHLNFLPSQQEEFSHMVVQSLSTKLDSLSPSKLVDLVWSLCVLQLVTPAFLEKALEPKIYEWFFGETSNKPNYTMKLIQINATAKLECPEYQGPLLPLNLLTNVSPPVLGNRQSAKQNDLHNVLLLLFEDRCDLLVKMVHGHQIDAEFVLDSEYNPLALQNFEDHLVLHSNRTDALPKGARRFAVKCWEFSDYCLRTKDLMGWNILCRRQLQAAGFLLVEVPFYEWQELKSEWQKADFLRDKIKKVASEQMSV